MASYAGVLRFVAVTSASRAMLWFVVVVKVRDGSNVRVWFDRKLPKFLALQTIEMRQSFRDW
jgi:hypothetical protein